MISIYEEIKIATLFFIIFGYITFYYIEKNMYPNISDIDIFMDYIKICIIIFIFVYIGVIIDTYILKKLTINNPYLFFLLLLFLGGIFGKIIIYNYKL
jgi:DMSO reductase anchor subunit